MSFPLDSGSILPTTNQPQPPSSGGGLNGGIAAAIVIVVLALVVSATTVVGLVVCFVRRQRRKQFKPEGLNKLAAIGTLKHYNYDNNMQKLIRKSFSEK